MLEELDRDIQRLEALIEQNEREYVAHPHMLGYREEFYNQNEYAEECRRIVGYLKKLRQFLNGENR